MRDLVPSLPALVLPPIGASSSPVVLPADVPGLVSDVERRFTALEVYCRDLGDVPDGDAEFQRLDDLVARAVHALAGAPSRGLAGIMAKARALIDCPAIEEDGVYSAHVGASLARDVLRLLGDRAHG